MVRSAVLVCLLQVSLSILLVSVSAQSDNDFCKGKPKGDYLDPNETCSGKVYTCKSDGTLLKRSCPGELVFDAKNASCTRKEHVEACRNNTTPSTPTTGLPSTPDHPSTTVESGSGLPDLVIDDSDFCSNKPKGDYLNPHETCSGKVYTCKSDGTLLKRSCPGELVFNEKAVSCTRKEHVEACRNKTTSSLSTTDHPMTTTVGIITTTEFTCSNRSEGYYIDVKDLCSGRFFKCARNGELHPMQCPKDFIFEMGADVQHASCIANSTASCAANEMMTSRMVEQGTSSYVTASPVTPVGDSTAETGHDIVTGSTDILSTTNKDHSIMLNMDGDVTSALENSSDINMPTTVIMPTSIGDNGSTDQLPRYVMPITEKSLNDSTFDNMNSTFDNMNSTFDNMNSTSDNMNSTSDNMNSTSDNMNSTSDIMTASTEISPASPKIEFSCDDLPSGNYPDPDKPCSSHFFTCTTDRRKFNHSCDPELLFDVVLNQCNTIDFVIGCGNATSETNKIIIDPFCENKTAGHYPDPNSNCSQMFYACTEDKVRTVRWCPFFEYYAGDNTCLAFDEVPGCKNSTADSNQDQSGTTVEGGDSSTVALMDSTTVTGIVGSSISDVDSISTISGIDSSTTVAGEETTTIEEETLPPLKVSDD